MGQACGSSQLPCKTGVSACVNGALVCQGGVGKQPEVCDGLDNDCNGQIDDGALADAPPPGNTGCWNNGGNCCSFGDLNWCPPPGGTCAGKGVLTNTCQVGRLVCSGGGWQCAAPVAPKAEVCDGRDNNCDGQTDEGTLPGVGAQCGANQPPCTTGLVTCAAGKLTCSGGVPGAPEVCNGVDDNCNGSIDEYVGLASACTPAYDTTTFSGDRTKGLCKPGCTAVSGPFRQRVYRRHRAEP
jgi:hypothetical protein